jgi:hypothetical protein
VFRRTCQTLCSGGLGFFEPSISWEVVALSALLELANGMEAQPAAVDARMINNAPRIIQADFLSGDIGTPISRLVCCATIASILCQTCDAVNVGFRAGGLGMGMPVCGPIAAVQFSEVANHVNCMPCKQPQPPHRTFPIVTGETKGCFSLHSGIILQ